MSFTTKFYRYHSVINCTELVSVLSFLLNILYFNIVYCMVSFQQFNTVGWACENLLILLPKCLLWDPVQVGVTPDKKAGWTATECGSIGGYRGSLSIVVNSCDVIDVTGSGALDSTEDPSTDDHHRMAQSNGRSSRCSWEVRSWSRVSIAVFLHYTIVYQ